jgi:hypothetical protein
MPRSHIPTYRLHKPSGQAVVTVRTTTGDRRDVYLGEYDSPESRAEDARVLAELASGASLPSSLGRPPRLRAGAVPAVDRLPAGRGHARAPVRHRHDARGVVLQAANTQDGPQEQETRHRDRPEGAGGAEAVLHYRPERIPVQSRRAVEEHHTERAARRKTPLYPSHAKNSAKRRVRVAKRAPAARYTTHAYNNAIRRAVEAVNRVGTRANQESARRTCPVGGSAPEQLRPGGPVGRVR